MSVMQTAHDGIHLTRIDLTNFKVFRRFSLSVAAMNILVGPNNCGKSTVVGACRALAGALRAARSRAPEAIREVPGLSRGWRISRDALPITVENIHHNYVEEPSTAKFTFSNRNTITLLFPADGGCILTAEGSKPILTAATFKKEFPIDIHHVPILGPVENEEPLVQTDTVARSLGTHRASRHFRNYWHHYPADFSSFAKLVRETWPGMEIEKPKIATLGETRLAMFCLEERMAREIYWAGFGFQVWCQLLTHLSAAREKGLLVLDEPETYLHPQMQRRLVRLLREAHPDIILATHSTEIMSDAEPSDIVVVHRAQVHGQRLSDIGEVQEALESVGSVQNITLTEISRHRRILFLEGVTDFKLVRQFASRLGYAELASGSGLTAVDSEGYSNWRKVIAAAWAFKKALGTELAIAAVFDRDFRCDEEVQETLRELSQKLLFAHVHTRKEIENYMLTPSALQRAVEREAAERASRNGGSGSVSVDVRALLDEITTQDRSALLGQYIAKRVAYMRSSTDQATLGKQAIEAFDITWADLDARMRIVAGKQTLSQLRARIHTETGLSLTNHKIISAIRIEEIDTDLKMMVRALEAFRSKVGDESGD
jgi:hypothetical protein